MGRSVLILAPKDDLHATALRTVLESKFDTRAIIWDVADIPTRAKLGFFPDENRFDLQIEDLSEDLSLCEIQSVWWRRLSSLKIDSAVVDPKLRRFCLSEYDTFFKGILNSIRIPIINDPAAEARAVHKPFQLAQAREVGLEIPKTIMSNDPESIMAFWDSLGGNCVYKAFNAPPWAFTETRHLAFEDLQYLNKVRHAPIIVQEKIDKGVDVRVNIFGEDVFAAEVTTHIADADLDWRIDMTAKWEPHCLPEATSTKLRSLLDKLGLQSGNIDLRRQTDGNYKFFEVNPSGQFLFVEIDTGQPLLESLSKLLVKAIS
jgi:glutathione synthase/RimK-type ligase-like ATP-grasp enzyme